MLEDVGEMPLRVGDDLQGLVDGIVGPARKRGSRAAFAVVVVVSGEHLLQALAPFPQLVDHQVAPDANLGARHQRVDCSPTKGSASPTSGRILPTTAETTSDITVAGAEQENTQRAQRRAPRLRALVL